MNVNQIIKGYHIIELIGAGGCGMAFKAEKDNKYYVLKMIAKKDMIESYKKNQNLLNKLFEIKSEYIVKYYESFVENGIPYIIMEYGGDTDLKKYIENQPPLLIEEKIIKDIVLQICLGLKEIHKNNLIHRDLTPDNIFMDKNYKIKIGDFGVSKILEPNQTTETQIGKINYIAPEIKNGEKYNNKIDIYSFGCIIYELLTLTPYLQYSKEKQEIDKNIYNPKWQTLIDLTLQEDYNKRPNIGKIYNYIETEINNKNEITCVYNKKDKERINLLHDFKDDSLEKDCKEPYNEAKNNINEKNIYQFYYYIFHRF